MAPPLRRAAMQAPQAPRRCRVREWHRRCTRPWSPVPRSRPARRRRLSDVVWSIDRRAADGSVRTMHVLIEHQSAVDHSMPLRFLNYSSLQEI